ncbi:three-Cys-motif partner protein TcmP [Catellatospora sp. NPDC049609]|uniref:three-Cys-motif partner protein TcmP n=1 Tax=Catellatospora sp. NPDC049609 TaxID=3155505 RepID=UPI00342DC489
MTNFFEEKRPAAILKHAILDNYIGPFAGKTGLYSPGNRVAFIDGYAGEGRYESGDEGSPCLLMRHARRLAAMRRPRQLECFFVEDDPQVFAKLQQVVASEGAGLQIALAQGKAAAQLPSLLSQVAGLPALVFLDPFGLMVPFETAVMPFMARPAGYGTPPTETLINFNASTLRRIAGHLTSPKAFESTLVRMDEVFGSADWRDIWLQHAPAGSTQAQREAAETAVVTEYSRRLAKAAGSGFWYTEVFNRAGNRPVYYLVFLTRHKDGMSSFAEALSLGLERWREALHKIENADSLFGDDSAFKASEDALAEAWVDEIEANLRKQLALGQPFRVVDHYMQVLGEAFGQAREKHLRKAWKRLHADGTTLVDSSGKDLFTKTIAPA